MVSKRTIGEILQIRWEDFNWKINTLTLPKTKTGQFRVIPLPKSFKALVGPYKKKKGHITHYRTPPKDPLHNAFNKAGIGRIPGDCWHILRHTYASCLHINQKVPLKTLAELLGHSTTRTTEIYAHITKDHLKDAVKDLTF